MAVKVAKMSSEVAWPLVTRAGELKKLDGRSAKSVLLLYFRLKNYPSDRYGNYFPKSGDRNERFHFKSRNIQRQFKYGGRWSNRWSVSIIDFAEDVLLAAGRDAEVPERVAHIQKKAKARVEAKSTAASRRKEKEARHEARKVANEFIIHRQWDKAFPILIQGKNHDAVKKFWTKAVKEELDVEQDKALEQILRGKEPQRPLYSTDQPPLFIFSPDFEVHWNERVGDVSYTVALTNRDKEAAVVHLGKSGGMGLRLDPTRMAITSSGLQTVGDAYAAGIIRKGEGKRKGKPWAILTAISAEGKDPGIRILFLWCDLLMGYGADLWVAQHVTNEEASLLQELAKLGKVKILDKNWNRRGHWQLRCVDD
jgi:hypothetical protein